jgi:hypothetical protein
MNNPNRPMIYWEAYGDGGGYHGYGGTPEGYSIHKLGECLAVYPGCEMPNFLLGIAEMVGDAKAMAEMPRQGGGAMNYRADWEERCKTDGSYAIALALLDVAYALRALGTGDAASTMGAIEYLSANIGEKLEGLNSAVTEVGSLVCEAIGELDNKKEMIDARR